MTVPFIQDQLSNLYIPVLDSGLFGEGSRYPGAFPLRDDDPEPVNVALFAKRAFASGIKHLKMTILD